MNDPLLLLPGGEYVWGFLWSGCLASCSFSVVRVHGFHQSSFHLWTKTDYFLFKLFFCNVYEILFLKKWNRRFLNVITFLLNKTGNGFSSPSEKCFVTLKCKMESWVIEDRPCEECWGGPLLYECPGVDKRKRLGRPSCVAGLGNATIDVAARPTRLSVTF